MNQFGELVLQRGYQLGVVVAQCIDGNAAQVTRAVTHGGDRFAAAQADPAVVELGWTHALTLHNRHGDLRRALESAERAYQLDLSEESFARILELKELQNERLDMEQA